MLPTFNMRQLRALAAVDHGTLALTGEHRGGPFFLTSTDDCARTGVWALSVTGTGDILRWPLGRNLDDAPNRESYPSVVARSAVNALTDLLEN